MTERLALLVWPSVYSSDWSTARATVSEHQLGGVLLMKPSGWDAGTLRQRLDELEQESTHGLIVATDEEGGDVQRLGELWPLASQFDVSTTMSPAAAGQLIAAHAARVADVGIDVVLGPVVDVLPSQGAPPLQRSRFFAGSPGEVSDYAAAYVGAWQQAGIEPVLKHFPGHGDASGDTHVGEGITAPLAELEQRDLVPYRALAASGAGVMVGHLETPGLTGDAPASRSECAIDYLRNQLGFGDGLIVSDSLDMDAVGVPVPQAAVESVRAGVDVVLFTDPTITADVIGALESAVGSGSLSPERVDAAASKVWRLLGHSTPLC
jgi:beta-N-acetylhexosaminidase